MRNGAYEFPVLDDRCAAHALYNASGYLQQLLITDFKNDAFVVVRGKAVPQDRYRIRLYAVAQISEYLGIAFFDLPARSRRDRSGTCSKLGGLLGGKRAIDAGGAILFDGTYLFGHKPAVKLPRLSGLSL